jgi:hypothetical protein
MSNEARNALLDHFSTRVKVDPDLSRSVVSFQASRDAPVRRWFRFKEAFSPDLVRRFLRQRQQEGKARKTLLDPFSGAGTALQAANEEGWNAIGIELLPVAVEAITVQRLARDVSLRDFEHCLLKLLNRDLKSGRSASYRFPHLRITEMAFPQGVEDSLAHYEDFLVTIPDSKLRRLFRFASLSVLEDVSFTRKDGQYLRWDHRSGRGKTKFKKARIPDFRTAVLAKLDQIHEDLRLMPPIKSGAKLGLISGSCLTELPKLDSESVDIVVTSPPYCNRYDYTRTYALELAYLGLDDRKVRDLRQNLLSATVENRGKQEELKVYYEKIGQIMTYEAALRAVSGSDALQEVLGVLNEANSKKLLNNTNIPRMISNYFFEMALVIFQLARIARPDGRIVMVNDNVQYFGEEIPVDLILSRIAELAGLEVEHISLLPTGKGNSSQQMGRHGRREIRKCIYIWQKPVLAKKRNDTFRRLQRRVTSN